MYNTINYLGFQECNDFALKSKTEKINLFLELGKVKKKMKFFLFLLCKCLLEIVIVNELDVVVNKLLVIRFVCISKLLQIARYA